MAHCCRFGFFLLILALGCGSGPDRQPSFNGTIGLLLGKARVWQVKHQEWRKLSQATKIAFGDSLHTSAESQVEITFDGSNTIRIDENSKIAISAFEDSAKGPGIEVFNCFGTVLSNIEKLGARRKQYRVTTPTSVASIRGTFFSVSFGIHARTSHVHVIAGNVWVANPYHPRRIVVVRPGFYTSVGIGRIPLGPAKINYGQWKKFQRLMRPAIYSKHGRKLKFKMGGAGRIKAKGFGKGSFKGPKHFKGPGKKGKGSGMIKKIGKMGKQAGKIGKKAAGKGAGKIGKAGKSKEGGESGKKGKGKEGGSSGKKGKGGKRGGKK